MKFSSLAIFVLLLSNCVFSQPNNKCLALRTFLESSKVKSGFRIDTLPNSLILLDRYNKGYNLCSINAWGVKSLNILYDSSISHKLKTNDPFRVFYGKCEILILEIAVKTKNVYHFGIIHSCSNAFIEGEVVERKGNKFHIMWVKAGDL